MQVFDGYSDTAVRLWTFAAVFIVMALLEFAMPKRRLTRPRAERWPANLAIIALDSLVVRSMAGLAVPLAAVAAAIYAQSAGWGLLNWLHWPVWLESIIAIVSLDFAIWLQHLASHKLPVLWRLHQMHHADVEIDVTTAIRFHPIEIALSMLWKIFWVMVLGAPAGAVLLFEVILTAMAMFNHGNVALPIWLDSTVRRLLVTPDMHRVHHSVLEREHNSNYGFNLSVWDRLFATYTEAPEQGHAGMTIGLNEFQSDAPTRLFWSLSVPFKSASKRD